MDLENIKQQQLNLLAKKALLQDELKQTETAIGQLAAVIQFATPQVSAETPSE